MLLSDKSIIDLCKGDNPMLIPFVEESVKLSKENKKIPSYGLSSYGYDVRMNTTIKIFRTEVTQIVRYVDNDNKFHELLVSGNNAGPNGFDYYDIDHGSDNSHLYVTIKNVKEIILPAGAFILANTVERFNMPDNVTGICTGKSTLARMGLSVFVTPIECGWSGYLTLEIKNLNTVPVKISTNTGVAQINFHRSEERCSVSYKDRNGKYNNQDNEPVDARL